MYVPPTRTPRITDTIELLPEKLESPNFSINEAIADILAEIRDMLTKTPPITTGDDEIKAIRELSSILTNYNKKILNGNTPEWNSDNTKILNENTPKWNIDKDNNKSPTQPITCQQTNIPHIIPDDSNIAQAVFHPDTGKEIKYLQAITKGPNKDIWNKAASNEFGRLAQGVANRLKGTGTIFFIDPKKLPIGKIPTYARFLIDIRPNKEEKHRVRITVGGNMIEYKYIVSTPTADLTTAKALLQSVISTHGARFHTLDIKIFYLQTRMKEYEYLRIPLTHIPEEIIQQYNLRKMGQVTKKHHTKM